MSEDDKFSHRVFLNDDETMLGAAQSHADMYEDLAGAPYLSGQVQISDCFRTVSLEFDVWDQTDVSAMLNKLDRIGDVLNHMREFINKHADRFPEKRETGE